MNEFDLQDIKNITKRKIAVSNFQSNNNMKKDRNSKLVLWARTLTSISACIILSCGIIFSKDISTHIYNYANNLKSEKTTVNNGNTAKFSGEYSISNEEIIDLENNNQGISQDNLKVKVEDLTMDDNNLKIKFDVELSEEISKKLNSKTGLEVEFEDLLITDENNNILVKFNKDNKENNDLNVFEGNTNSYVLKYDGKNAKVIYSMNLVGKEKYFPRCSNLKLEIENIKIINDVENEFGGTQLKYQGNWSLYVELPENIVNRKMIKYKVAEESSEENKVLYFNILDSGTEVKLRLKAPEVEDDISPQLKLINALELENPSTQIRDYFVDELMASDEYGKYEEELRKKYIIQENYIEDENGKKYELLRGAYSNGGGNVTEDNFYEPTLVFNIKPNNAENNFKLHIKYCDIDYVFELVKEGEV